MLQYSEDIKCRLLSGVPIRISGVSVCRVTIDKIADIGFNSYFNTLGLLMMTPEDIQAKFIDMPSIKNVFDVMAVIKYADEAIFNEHNKVFSLVFGEPISMIDKDGAHLENSKCIINQDNITDIIAAIRMRNGLYSEDGSDEFSENPSNENVRHLLERRRKMRNKVASMKKNKDSGLGYSDILSIYSSIVGKSPSDVARKYDLYQLSNQLQRYQMHEQFEIQIQSMMHGAKIEDEDFKHYMRQMGNDSSDD